MDLPRPAAPLPEQLPLPLELPALDTTAHLPHPVLAPAQLWSSLTPQVRLTCRQTLVRILQEVIHDRERQREDHAASS